MAEFGFEPGKATAHLQTADPTMSRIIDSAGPFAMELKKGRKGFSALAEAIVYRQLASNAAATIFGRLCGHFPRGATGLTAERPLALSDAKIRGAGISQPKLKSLRDLARRTVAGVVQTLAATRRLSDAEIIEEMAPLPHGGELISAADIDQVVRSHRSFMHATGVTHQP